MTVKCPHCKNEIEVHKDRYGARYTGACKHFELSETGGKLKIEFLPIEKGAQTHGQS